MMDKRCPRCSTTKPLSDFHKNRSRPDGHNQYCKMCARVIWAEYERIKRESPTFRSMRALATAKWVAEHPDRHRAKCESFVREEQGRTAPRAQRSGARWTAEDLDVALSDDRSVEDVAILLGRTYLAVVSARQRYRDQGATEMPAS